MEYIEIFNKIGFFGFIFMILGFLIKRYYNKKDMNEEKENSAEKKITEVEHEISEIYEIKEDYDNTFVKYDKALFEIRQTIECYTEAMQALLRDRIIQIHNHYIEKKYFPIYARESLSRIYDIYKKLKGNGVVDGLVEELMNLPTNKPL